MKAIISRIEARNAHTLAVIGVLHGVLHVEHLGQIAYLEPWDAPDRYDAARQPASVLGERDWRTFEPFVS